jgi:CDP-glycerol glycerophosphotransferase (TagB/SpsB family)
MLEKIRRLFQVIYKYKIDLLERKLLMMFLKHKKIKNIIVIESHNDFDCNGGAFYDYLIENGYNKNYKICWLLKNRKPKELPENVYAYSLYRPSLKKNYMICMAKYLLADNTITPKVRNEQKSFFLTHGAGGLKSVRGKMLIDESVDYVLVQSENYAKIQAYQYSMEYPNNKLVCLGYPVHDILNSPSENELAKITSTKYNKVVLWMPTFRKGGGYHRNDSKKDYPLGVPLFNNIDEYKELSDELELKNILLILKIHPMQDLSNLKVFSTKNIVVLTGNDVKRLNVDNYRLMKCTDALISDYSSVAFEYLQLNKPIAYVLDDMTEYKLGFVVDDIDTLIAGNKIFNYQDLSEFINEVSNDYDKFAERRLSIRNYIYKYHDTHSCERLARFMKL